MVKDHIVGSGAAPKYKTPSIYQVGEYIIFIHAIRVQTKVPLITKAAI
jgi:hypothetical protein